LNKPRYGGGLNDQVLIQEFADGPEFAVDTIAQDGNIKVVALWKYHKLEANGAPFVYQCSELISSEGAVEQEVCDYCLDVLKVQDLKWGPTHTEIKYTSKGPRLIEINARWHAQHFPPIVDACIGYDAITTTLDAFFYPEKFNAIPRLPGKLNGAGRILHLISYVDGKVKAINHVDEIQALESAILVNVEPEVGDEVRKTVDIRTDCGYVLLYHDDPKKVLEDYDAIVKYQSDLFTTYASPEEEDEETMQEIASMPSFSSLPATSLETSPELPTTGLEEREVKASAEAAPAPPAAPAEESFAQIDYNRPIAPSVGSYFPSQTTLSAMPKKLGIEKHLRKLGSLVQLSKPLALRWLKAILSTTLLGYVTLNLLVIVLPMLLGDYLV
jgi:hypothetical protein